VQNAHLYNDGEGPGYEGGASTEAARHQSWLLRTIKTSGELNVLDSRVNKTAFKSIFIFLPPFTTNPYTPRTPHTPHISPHYHRTK
jgi:hypothetical protein